MCVPKFKISEIPSEAFVVRISKTNNYVHVTDDYSIFIKQKMNGCLVLRCKADAEEMVSTIKRIESDLLDSLGEFKAELTTHYEAVPFADAYNTHGIDEKQVAFN